MTANSGPLSLLPAALCAGGGLSSGSAARLRRGDHLAGRHLTAKGDDSGSGGDRGGMADTGQNQRE